MTVEEIVDMIWAEYRHAYSMLEPKRLSKTFLQASGHAQCALSLLSKLRENTTQQHKDMAAVMAFIIGDVPGYS